MYFLSHASNSFSCSKFPLSFSFFPCAHSTQFHSISVPAVFPNPLHTADEAQYALHNFQWVLSLFFQIWRKLRDRCFQQLKKNFSFAPHFQHSFFQHHRETCAENVQTSWNAPAIILARNRTDLWRSTKFGGQRTTKTFFSAFRVLSTLQLDLLTAVLKWDCSDSLPLHFFPEWWNVYQLRLHKKTLRVESECLCVTNSNKWMSERNMIFHVLVCPVAIHHWMNFLKVFFLYEF